MKIRTMRSVKSVAAIALFPFIIISCGKIEKLPPEPVIAFKSFEVFDSVDILGNKNKAGRLHFHFQDGDGDLGLESPQVSGLSDSTNLFFTLYRKTRGTFHQVSDSDLIRPYPYRIPFMDRQGQNKILKGDIAITFFYLFVSPADTIRYSFFVKDRAQHVSNTDSTCVIVLTENGICSR
jgi:hypothetical protein